MNQQQWNEGLDHMDEELLQTYLLEKEQNRQKQRTTTHRMYIAAVACILCLIVVTLVLAPILKSRMQSQNDAPILQDNTSPVIGNTEGSTAPAIENTEGSTENENSSMGISVIYAPDHSADYEPPSYDRLKRRHSLSMTEDSGFALCLVTAMNIDLSDVSSATVGVRVPMTLRIDRVILSNDAFDMTQGESFLTAGYFFWSRKGEDYSVHYRDGNLPITEQGAQYIVVLNERAPFYDISFDIKYTTSCYTIPIASSAMSADEIATIYAQMQMLKSERKLSLELIKEAFGENYVPSFDEVETVLGEIRPYNPNQFIELTYDQIVARYGEFDFLRFKDQETGTYAYGYVVLQGNVGSEAMDPPIYFIVYFNENGVAYKCAYDDERLGG